MNNRQGAHATLVLPGRAPYLFVMRAQTPIIFCLGLLLAQLGSTLPAAAQNRAPAPAAGPHKLGTFEDWTAARHQEDGKAVCYAFTRSAKSTPAVPGRGEVVLTVTQRPSGRDSVAISAGFAYPPNADVTVTVDTTALNFYTNQRFAFAKEGPATVAALQRGRQAISRGPSPRNVPVEDTFSLRGFGAAYAAIVKACPPTR